MKTTDFDFDLPEHLIAQHPMTPRDHSKLLVVDRNKRTISHHYFYELPDLLPPDTLIIRNNSKVIKARLKGRVATGGQVELFLLEQKSGRSGWFLAKPGRKFAVGTMTEVTFYNRKSEEKTIGIQCRESKEDGSRELVFLNLDCSFHDFLEQFGEVPLPPYIKKENPNQEHTRYQTNFAKHEGSVAAPTAGLHFTTEVDNRLLSLGHHIDEITLHVGAGTFMPVKTEQITDHTMHAEQYVVSPSTLSRICASKSEGHKTLCVGTTSTRTLEHIFSSDNICTKDVKEPLTGSTSIYIYPGYSFKAVDILLTNFHLPKSTLMMLVSAFIGDIDFTKRCYQEAIDHEYRFYSYGDAMLIR